LEYLRNGYENSKIDETLQVLGAKNRKQIQAVIKRIYTIMKEMNKEQDRTVRRECDGKKTEED